MAYRSVLGAYSKPRALVSVKTARAVDFYHTVTGSTTVLDYGDANLDTSDPKQLINVSNNPQAYLGLSEFAVTLTYDTSDDNNQSQGIAFRIHFDSSKLSLLSVENHVNHGYVQTETAVLDTDDLDNDAVTDKYVMLRWVRTNNLWPGTNEALPLQLATVKFSVSDDIAARGNTTLNFSPVQTSYGYIFRAQSVPIDIAYVSFDIDKDGRLDALTDGLLFLRYLFGGGTATGEQLTQGAISAQASLTPQEVEENVKTVTEVIGDIDGSGNVDALTDGLLLLRYAFGIRGDALANSAVALNATRTTGADIENYIENFLPRIFSDPVPAPEEAENVQRADTRSVLSVTIPKAISTAISLKALNNAVTPRLVDPVLSDISRKIHVEQTFVALQAIAHYTTIVPIVNYPKIVAKELGDLPIDMPLANDFNITEVLTRTVGKTLTSPDVSMADAAPHFAVSKLETDSFSVKDKESLRVIFNREFSGVDEQVTLTEEPALDFDKEPTVDKHATRETVNQFGYFSAPTTNDLFGMADSAIPKYDFGRSDSDDFFTVSETSVEKSFATTKTNSQGSAETVVQFIGYSEVVTDSINLLDTLSGPAINTAKTNSFGIGDKETLRVTFERTFSGSDEAISNITDVLSFSKGLFPANEQASKETVFNSIYNNISTTDEIIVADPITTFTRGLPRSHAFGIGDSPPKLSAAKSFSEDLFNREEFNKSVFYFEKFTDKVDILDTFSTGDITTTKTNAFGIGDVFSREAIFERVFSGPDENISSIKDAPSFNLGYFINDPLDSQNLSEAVVNVVFAQEVINEITSLKDVVTPVFGKSVADIATIKDGLATLSYVKPELNAAVPSESVAPFVSYMHVATDGFRLDSAIDLGDIGINKENVFSMGDKETLRVTFERTFSGSDEAIANITDEQKFKQGIAFTNFFDPREIIAFNAGYVEKPNNIITILEQITPAFTKKPVSPPVNVTDENVLEYVKATSNVTSTAENVFNSIFYAHTATDGFKLDSSVDLGDIGINKDNIFGVSDKESLKVIFNRTFSGVNESITNITDAPEFIQGKTLTESLLPNEGTTFFSYFTLLESDSMGFLDFARPSLGKAVSLGLSTDDSQFSFTYDKPLTNSASTDETVFNSNFYSHTAADAFTLDSTIDLGDIGINKDNIFGIGDVRTLRVEYERVFTQGNSYSVTEASLVTQGKGLIDTQTTTENFVTAIYNVLKFAPTAFSDQNAIKLAQDTQSFSFGKNFSSIEDKATIGDLAPVLDVVNSPSDVHTASEIFTFIFNHKEIITDFINVEDDSGVAENETKNKVNFFGVRDKESLLVKYNRSFPELNEFTFTDVAVLSQAKKLTDLQGTSEAVVNVHHYIEKLSSLITLTEEDFVTLSVAHAVQASGDTFSVSDEDTREVIFERTFTGANETYNVTEVSTLKTGKAPTDSVSSQEAAYVQAYHVERILETITIQDNPTETHGEGLGLSTAKQVSIGDKASLEVIFGRTFSGADEQYAITDAQPIVSITKNLSETPATQEAVVQFVNYKEIANDSINITDTALQGLSRVQTKTPDTDSYGITDDASYEVIFRRTVSGATEEFNITEVSVLSKLKSLSDTSTVSEDLNEVVFYQEPTTSELTFGTDTVTVNLARSLRVTKTETLNISDDVSSETQFDGLSVGDMVVIQDAFNANNPNIIYQGNNTRQIVIDEGVFYAIGIRTPDSVSRGSIRQTIDTTVGAKHVVSIFCLLNFLHTSDFLSIAAFASDGSLISTTGELNPLDRQGVSQLEFIPTSTQTTIVIEGAGTSGGIQYFADLSVTRQSDFVGFSDNIQTVGVGKDLSETVESTEFVNVKNYYTQKILERIIVQDDKLDSTLGIDVNLINLNLDITSQVYQLIDIIYGTVMGQPYSTINAGTLYQHSEGLRLSKLLGFPPHIIEFFQQLVDIKTALQVDRSIRQSKTVGPPPASAPSGPPESELSVSEQSSLQISINLADTANLSDVLSLTATFDRSFGETFGLDDLSDLPTTSVLNKTNTFGLSEVVTKTIAFGRAVSDSSTILESASLNPSKDFGHSLGVSDLPTISTVKSVGDFAGFTETVSLSFSKRLTDTQNTSDNGGTIVYSQSTTDSFAITESISTSLVRTTGAVNHSVINSEPLN